MASYTIARPSTSGATIASHQIFFDSLAASTALAQSRRACDNNCSAVLYSCAITKTFRRNIIRAWKRATLARRKHERASIIPDGFVLLSAKVA